MTLKEQYEQWLVKNPNHTTTYDEWLKKWEETKLLFISDDFQIGPDGAYEHTEDYETIAAQKQLIQLYENQIMDLTVMSKIELGDDVIAEIKRLKKILNFDPTDFEMYQLTNQISEITNIENPPTKTTK